ncbi:MAG: hypothetical protein ACPG5B_10885 [Chitinophagales bacterium]
MKFIIQICCLFLLLSSCENTPLMQQNTTALSPEDSLILIEKQIDDTRLNILPSQQISTSDVYIYPIGSALKKSRGSSYSKKGSSYRIWNLIFYNFKTNEKRTLFSDKVPIIEEYPNENDFQYMYNREIAYDKLKKTRKDKLFYKIVDTDFNKNGVIDYADPSNLFMSDLNGENFTKISPANIDLRTWKFMDSTKNVIEITGYRDSDENLKFENDKDEHVILLLNLNNLQQKVDVFPSDFQNNLKEIYIKNKGKYEK